MCESPDVTLAELLCARLCHDLAGPVNAIGTGAELLAQDDLEEGLARDATTLLSESASTAAARLRFLRLALGGSGGALPSVELRDVTTAFLAASRSGAGRYGLEWRDGGDTPFEPGLAKLILNLALVAQNCLPRGGTVAVRARIPNRGSVAEIGAVGDTVARGQAMEGLAAAAFSQVGPRGAQGYYTACLARGLNMTVESVADPREIRFVVTRNPPQN